MMMRSFRLHNVWRFEKDSKQNSSGSFACVHHGCSHPVLGDAMRLACVRVHSACISGCVHVLSACICGRCTDIYLSRCCTGNYVHKRRLGFEIGICFFGMRAVLHEETPRTMTV